MLAALRFCKIGGVNRRIQSLVEQSMRDHGHCEISTDALMNDWKFIYEPDSIEDFRYWCHIMGWKANRSDIPSVVTVSR